MGLASLYLPGAPNPIPHVVTSHAPLPSHPTIPAAKPSPPISYKKLSNLLKGTTTDIMFQQYAKAFKSSQSQEFLSKLNKSDLPDATTGFDFLAKVFHWMHQDLNKKLPTGYQFADNNDRWRVDLFAQDNYTTWLLRHYNIESTDRKSVLYLAINLMIAKRMGWVVETASNVFDVGPNLLMELPQGITSVKTDPATCLNAKFTFTKPLNVVDGLLYLCSTFSWRFVNLNEAFEKATSQHFEPPKTKMNVFQPWMSNLSLWRMATGLNLDDSFIELPVSAHHWKPTALSVSLLEGVKIVDGVSKGEYNGHLEIDMSSLTQNNTYTVALEWYQKDQWLFNHSQFSADGTGLEIHNVTITKHTHEQNKTHWIYYHTLTIQFTKSVSGNATLNVKFEIGYLLPSTYPDELKGNTYLVIYGVNGAVTQVPDVYEDHPVIQSSHTTTGTTTQSTEFKNSNYNTQKTWPSD